MTTRESGCAVSAVIVNWRSYQLVVECVAAFEARTRLTPREVIVVDNSQDEEGRKLWHASLGDGVERAFNSSNLGFAAACNQGVSLASADHLLLLNPDAVVHEATVDSMAALLDRHPELAAVGAQLLNEDGTLQPSAYRLYPGLSRAFLDLTGLRYAWLFLARPRRAATGGPAAGIRQVAWLKGACLMIRREAYSAVGPLDEDFFLFGEDVDWCYRARGAGWQVALAPGCLATHIGERSVVNDRPAGIAAYYASYLRFILKHQGPGVFGLRALAARSLLKLGAMSRFAALATVSVARPDRRAEARGYWRYLTSR